MSRIGKKAVTVPTGVTANVEGQTVKVKGPKGALQLVLHDDLVAKMDKEGSRSIRAPRPSAHVRSGAPIARWSAT
jgi:large subunit ribosomal protein L6